MLHWPCLNPSQESSVSFSDNPSLHVPVERGVPHTRVFDSTLTLLSEGYPFLQT